MADFLFPLFFFNPRDQRGSFCFPNHSKTLKSATFSPATPVYLLYLHISFFFCGILHSHLSLWTSSLTETLLQATRTRWLCVTFSFFPVETLPFVGAPRYRRPTCVGVKVVVVRLVAVLETHHHLHLLKLLELRHGCRCQA